MANVPLAREVAPALGTPAQPGSPGGGWAHYRPILASRDFIAAAAVLLLTSLSWGLYLGGAPDQVVSTLGWAGALAGGAVIGWGALAGLLHREMNVDELSRSPSSPH